MVLNRPRGSKLRLVLDELSAVIFTFPSWLQESVHSSEHRVLTQQYLKQERKGRVLLTCFSLYQGAKSSPKVSLSGRLSLRYHWTGFNHMLKLDVPGKWRIRKF